MGSPPAAADPSAGTLALRLWGRFARRIAMAAYVGQKYLLQWIAEPLDRPGKRQPFKPRRYPSSLGSSAPPSARMSQNRTTFGRLAPPGK